MFNGSIVASNRVQLGTLTGVVGVGVLQQVGMRGIASTFRPGGLRQLAAGSATGFAVTGSLAHLCCGAVILAYKRLVEIEVDPHDGPRPAPRSATPLLAVSAVGALTALAIFSSSLIIAERHHESNASTSRMVLTPLPCVVSTLLTFGLLPAPLGGWARPASISFGLIGYFAVTAASG